MLLSASTATAKARLARETTHAVRELLVGYKALLESSLREEGLTLPQLRLLHAVAERQEVSAAAIARLCLITPQTLQAMLERAVREGWITRSVPRSNHRILTAQLTAKGRALLARVEAQAAAIEAVIWRGVSTERLKQVNREFSRGVDNLRSELAARETE
jgi:DNA-binding MarR family transcriptional regulator